MQAEQPIARRKKEMKKKKSNSQLQGMQRTATNIGPPHPAYAPLSSSPTFPRLAHWRHRNQQASSQDCAHGWRLDGGKVVVDGRRH